MLWQLWCCHPRPYCARCFHPEDSAALQSNRDCQNAATAREQVTWKHSVASAWGPHPTLCGAPILSDPGLVGTQGLHSLWFVLLRCLVFSADRNESCELVILPRFSFARLGVSSTVKS